MFIIVDEREIVTRAYRFSFEREGVSSAGFCPGDFTSWIKTADTPDVQAVEAFLLADCKDWRGYPSLIRGRSEAPLIAMYDDRDLERTLEFFAAGADDVVKKPVHARELLARVGAIRRRAITSAPAITIGALCIYSDGRDPTIEGEVFPLPRRERRILEYLVSCRGRLVSKSQIFTAIYGVFDENVEESVVESHVSKLRKKLRMRLGYDPIESRRYLGYRLIDDR